MELWYKVKKGMTQAQLNLWNQHIESSRRQTSFTNILVLSTALTQQWASVVNLPQLEAEFFSIEFETSDCKEIKTHPYRKLAAIF